MFLKSYSFSGNVDIWNNYYSKFQISNFKLEYVISYVSKKPLSFREQNKFWNVYNLNVMFSLLLAEGFVEHKAVNVFKKLE